MRAYPSDLLDAPRTVRLTLLAVLCWTRQSEITDALVDLLIGLIHRMNARAERRVERELLDDLRRVRNKDGVLFALAEAALDRPDDTVREALFPVVGESTLRDLVREAKETQRWCLPKPSPHGVDQFLHRSLPANAAPAVGRARFPVQQHGRPAGDRRAGTAASLRQPRRTVQALRRGRTNPDRRGGAGRVARGCARRAGPSAGGSGAGRTRPRRENDLPVRLPRRSRPAPRDPRRPAGVENWNSANGVFFYGKDSQLTGDDREHQEVSILALHLLQSATVLVNTMLLQNVLEDPPGRHDSGLRTGAGYHRCCGPTSTPTARSAST